MKNLREIRTSSNQVNDLTTSSELLKLLKWNPLGWPLKWNSNKNSRSKERPVTISHYSKQKICHIRWKLHFIQCICCSLKNLYKKYAVCVLLFKFWIACSLLLYFLFILFLLYRLFFLLKNRKEMNEIPCMPTVGEWNCSSIRKYNKNNNNNEIVKIYVKSRIYYLKKKDERKRKKELLHWFGSNRWIFLFYNNWVILNQINSNETEEDVEILKLDF